MENLLQVNDAQQTSIVSNEANLSASTFLVNEFRYKCTANHDGFVDEVIFTDPYSPGYDAESMKNLGSPQNPRYADQTGSGEPSEQVQKAAPDRARDPSSSSSDLELVAEMTTECR